MEGTTAAANPKTDPQEGGETAQTLIQTFLEPKLRTARLTFVNGLKFRGKSLDICRQVESALFRGGRIELDRPGPSLETGLPRITAKDMTHFASRPLFDWTR